MDSNQGDRSRVLALLEDMVDNGGGLVIANDSCLVRPATHWQQAIERIQAEFLPRDFAPPVPPSGRADDAEHLTHEEILSRSQFRKVDRRTYEYERAWTVEQAIGYLHSTSLPLRRALGDQRAVIGELPGDEAEALVAALPALKHLAEAESQDREGPRQ
jgi:hypothetical protein